MITGPVVVSQVTALRIEQASSLRKEDAVIYILCGRRLPVERVGLVHRRIPVPVTFELLRKLSNVTPGDREIAEDLPLYGQVHGLRVGNYQVRVGGNEVRGQRE